MDIKLPTLGEGADSGTVVTILVKEGDRVAKDQLIIELETEKAVGSIPSDATGTVTKIEWANPHVWFYIDVKDETGTVTNWAMEMGGPNGLLRAGWTRNSMKPGDVVTVDGFQARTGKSIGNATAVILASTGQRLFAASSQGQ